MESFKKYLPWIIGAVVILYVFRKLTTKTSFVPQTQLIQTPRPDPYAEMRAKAFDLLAGVGIAQIQGDVAKAKIIADENVQLTNADYQNRLANLSFLQRDQDRQLQQGAIDRYYSSRDTQAIIGSIGQTIGQIFANRNTGSYRTPPIFSSGSSFDFGGF